MSLPQRLITEQSDGRWKAIIHYQGITSHLGYWDSQQAAIECIGYLYAAVIEENDDTEVMISSAQITSMELGRFV